MTVRLFRLLILVATLSLVAALPLGRTSAARAGTPAASPAVSTPTTVPALADWAPASGSYRLASRSRVLVGSDAVLDEADTFIADLRASLHRSLPRARSSESPKPGDIVLRLDSKRRDLGAEG